MEQNFNDRTVIGRRIFDDGECREYEATCYNWFRESGVSESKDFSHGDITMGFRKVSRVEYMSHGIIRDRSNRFAENLTLDGDYSFYMKERFNFEKTGNVVECEMEAFIQRGDEECCMRDVDCDVTEMEEMVKMLNKMIAFKKEHAWS